MKIRYIGHSSFKISGKSQFGEEVTVITDPFDSKSVGITYPKQTADVVTLSHHHDDHNKIENIDGDPVVIETPGEYEVKGLRIFGLKSYHDDKKGSERGKNTIYIYDFMEARIAHLGDLGHPLESDQLEELENIDILMVPVGGIYTIDSKIAMQVIESIEPSVTIPMHYKTTKHSKDYADLAELNTFLNEAGVEVEPEKELSIKSHNDLTQIKNILPLSF